jgi:hypothetical protein
VEGVREELISSRIGKIQDSNKEGKESQNILVKVKESSLNNIAVRRCM